MNTVKTPIKSSVLHVNFGEFELDEQNALLLRSGKAVPLAPIPFNLLCTLLRQPQALLSKHELLDLVWGHRFVSASVLKGAISDIRNVLGDDSSHPSYIETVSRRGYRFIAAIESKRNEPVVQRLDVNGPSDGTNAPVFQTEQECLFVGRKIELARLQRAWACAVRGHRAIISWVVGEPGIGKTALIEHFLSTLDGVVYVRGQCVQHHGSSEPYLPVLEALAELCRRDERAAPLLRAVAPTWLLQLPWLCTAEQREALLHELVGSNPQRMLRELGEFMDRYTQHQPLLLITEDLHWGDHSTIQLIDYLARRRGNGRLMWLGSFRLTEIIAFTHPLKELRHELRRQGLCEEIVLDSFSEADVAVYVQERAPEMVANECFIQALHERTSGVPLFVASITNEVITRSVGHDAIEALTLACTTIPESLSELIDHYVTKLPDDRRRLLVAAAVCGMELHVEALSRVLELDVVPIAEACHELAREQFWLLLQRPTEYETEDAGPCYVFRHALFRQRLYDGMAASTRTELHRRFGVALERERSAGRMVAAAKLAMHFDRGRVPLMALRYYAEAAQAALLHLSPAECMSLTERALILIEQAPASMERDSLEITLTTLRGCAAFHTLGAGEDTRKSYQRAARRLLDLPAHPMAGLALHGLGFLLTLRGEYSEALIVAARAQALAGESQDPLLMLAACSTEGHVLTMQGNFVAARTALELALPSLERVNATAEHYFIGFIADPQATIQGLLSLALTQLGLLTQAREQLQHAYSRSRQLAQPMALMVTIWFDALCGIRLGDVARVMVLAREMRSLVEEYSLAQGRAAYCWFQGWAEAQCGKPHEGFLQIRKAYEENRALGMISGGSETLGYAAEALVLQGDLAQAQLQLDQALELVDCYGERIVLPQLLLIQAKIDSAYGESTAAATSVRRALVEARSQGACWLELLALTELCESGYSRPEERDELIKLVAQLAEVCDAFQLEKSQAWIASHS